jgi:hypothetical protein
MKSILIKKDERRKASRYPGTLARASCYHIFETCWSALLGEQVLPQLNKKNKQRSRRGSKTKQRSAAGEILLSGAKGLALRVQVRLRD